MILLLSFIIFIFILKRVMESIIDHHDDVNMNSLAFIFLSAISTPFTFIYDFIISTFLFVKHFKFDLFKFFSSKPAPIKFTDLIKRFVDTARRSVVTGCFLVFVLNYVINKLEKKNDLSKAERDLFESFRR